MVHPPDAPPDAPPALSSLYEIRPKRPPRLCLHKGQRAAWDSDKRFVCVLAGTQGGKTSYLPWWLRREIYGNATFKGRGAGDYLAVTSTYELFRSKFLPSIREVFEHVTRTARYWPSARVLELMDPKTERFWARRADDPMWGRIMLRSAESPGGLESATAKAAILDEAGQASYTLEAYHAILRRLSLNMGRLLIGTTIYNFGWLKTEVYDRWLAGDPDYEVVHFDSTENPNFPRAEWERARRSMPAWKFDMQYRGRYSRPAGLIYDAFTDESYPAGHLCRRFEVPWDWKRHLGLDFGGVHTAGTFWAEDPQTGYLYGYRESLAGDMTTEEHARALCSGEPKFALACGGSWSEDQWRREFKRAGIDVKRPDISDVNVGIDRVYGGFKERKVFIFDDLTGLRKELREYSRKLGSDGEPIDVIEHKERYHLLDATRYILGMRLGPTAAERRVRKLDNPLAGYSGTGRSMRGTRREDARREY